jgi:hypothetical protein
MVKNQAEQGEQLATPEELKNRADALGRKRLQRKREAVAKALHARSQDRQQFWAENRARLDPTELQALEARQAEFVYLAWIVEEVTSKLKPGTLIGPPNGICFPDAVFEEAQAWRLATNPSNRIVWHPNPAEFADLHHPDNKCLLDLFKSADPEWFDLGYYTRFQVGVLDEFVKVVAEFINENPNHPDFDPEISQQILAERAKRIGRRPSTAGIQTDTEEVANIRDGGNESWTELQNDKERLKSMKELSKLPVRDF